MAVTGTPGGPRYRRASTVVMTDGGVVRHDGSAQPPVRLSPRQAALLQRCATFCTVGELARLPGFVRADLDALESAGWVETDVTILRRCAERTAPQPEAPITELGVLTCQSPDLLRRSVASWVVFARHHLRTLRVTIADDSPTQVAADAQRAAARALERELGIELRFVDPGTRAQLAADLARAAGIDPELTAFMFAGRAQPRIGIGGNRNLIGLLTRGQRVLSVDDDIVARFEMPPRHDIALWILSEDVPTIVSFFESAEETEARVGMSVEPDALAMHEAFCGHTVADIVTRLDGVASLTGAGPALTAAITQRPVRIAATTLGLAGDSASDCAAFYSMAATGETARNFLARPMPLPPSREVLRRPFFPVLCQGAYLMTYCCALDNTLPLPPFYPVGRGEDQVWQKLLHATLPDTVVGHLPLAALHRPGRPREYSRADYLDPCATFDGNALLLGLLDVCRPSASASDADQRLALVGRELAERARDPSGFASLVQAAWRTYLTQHRNIVASVLDSRPEHPVAWRENMAIAAARLDAQLSEAGRVPLSYASLTGAAAVDALRFDLLKFAALLQAWPALRAGAERTFGPLRADTTWLRP